MPDMDSDHARERLDEERARLEEIRGSLESMKNESEQESLGDLSASDQHQADTGTETFDREKDFSILEQVEAELADVSHALKRLDDGTYGVCEACGKPIDDERLDAVPAARFCLADQASAEREIRSTAVD
jgi:RNA polymerase-binding transcription factor DksA